MMRNLLIPILLACSCTAWSQPFTIRVDASKFAEDVVSLYRIDDLFTQRKVFLVRNIVGADGKAILTGKAKGTAKMQLRIGDHVADLFVRPGSDLNVTATPTDEARSLSGTTRMDLVFTDLDPMDINALTSDANERIDTFIAEDLATDEAAGMQVLTIQRKEEAKKQDPPARPPTLFVTPVLSKAELDTFDMKMRRFYADVKDPWFAHYLDYGLAGLRIGVRANEKELFERYLKGKPVQYDDPEYVRFIRTFFADQLEQVYQEFPDSTALAADGIALRHLFQRNDFLRSDDRLAEVVMLDQLYLKHAKGIIPQAKAERILAEAMDHSEFAEHRVIAANILWDLTTMRVGSVLPAVRLEDPRGNIVDLKEQLNGPVCIALTAGWCTYCAVEMEALAQLGVQYPDAVKIIIINLDRDLDDFNADRKKSPAKELLWYHALAEQELREQLRIRSLPVVYLLNDSVLARAPAPMPSNGLGVLFHQAKMQQQQDKRIKVWDD